MELREFAERVLLSGSLEEKLKLTPDVITDFDPGSAIHLPDQPGRPEELVMAPRDARANFPGVKQLEKEQERGKMLHFLANHELLATELMALVLLKFPDAPKEFRMGVYRTLREEQAHTLMYMRRMKECGLHFGELPVNDYFWRMVSGMEEPIDFVTRLSLTFEQANLDFSKHYATLFRQVGDSSTANVLEKIYADEIEHVGHGLKWFKMWKSKELTDWKAYQQQLRFPLTPSKAKGAAPFDREGRLAAGLDETFIHHLQVTEGSRGRTPVVHLFNANAEGYVLAAQKELAYTPRKAEVSLDQDLEILPMSWARRDDVVLVDQMPSLDHLHYLQQAKMVLPEWVLREDDLSDRKLGGMQPWAWSPDAVKMLEKYRNVTFDKSEKSWRGDFDMTLFSKVSSSELIHIVQPEAESVVCRSLLDVEIFVEKQSRDVIFKAPYASAGRGQRNFLPREGWVDSLKHWVENTILKQGAIVVEPLLKRELDFSAQYERAKDGKVKLLGMTRVINDKAGRFLGSFVHPKWASGLDENLTAWLFRDQQVMQLYKYDLPERLEEWFKKFDYYGAFGIDAFVYRDKAGDFGLRKVVEINPRITMGRVALELHKKTKAIAGFYEIVRKSTVEGDFGEWLAKKNHGIENPTVQYGSVCLNDYRIASSFYAIWHGRKNWEECSQLIDRVSLK